MKDKKYCIVCGNELQGSQRLYCSNACKQKANYQNLKKNTNTVLSQTLRGYRRKLALIEAKGGKCEKCGYDKNIAALEFHHIDSSTKLFQLDGRMLSNKKWEDLQQEADKCLLLCANCHREIHHPDMTKEQIEQLKSKSEYSDLNREERTYSKVCPVCGKTFPKVTGKVYCSEECKEQAKFKDKNYPSYEEISKVYDETKSWTKVAEHFNLTRKIITGIRDRYLKTQKQDKTL